MPVCIEITCRDVEVSSKTRQLVFVHAQMVHDYADLIEVCHVIIRRRGTGGSSRAFAVSIDLIMPDGRVLATCLRDRHRYFESLEAAIDEAFYELQCWLRDVAPSWRNAPVCVAGQLCPSPSEPIDHPENLLEQHVVMSSLVGTHHFVG